jgi:anti-sigma B factor antagonist
LDHPGVRSFQLVERQVEPGCCEIVVEGEVELAVAPQVRSALKRALGEHERVLIDLRRCDFIDSTGIALFVEAYNQARERGRQVALHGATGQVLRVLSVTGLTENGLVFETAEAALADR